MRFVKKGISFYINRDAIKYILINEYLLKMNLHNDEEALKHNASVMEFGGYTEN